MSEENICEGCMNKKNQYNNGRIWCKIYGDVDPRHQDGCDDRLPPESWVSA